MNISKKASPLTLRRHPANPILCPSDAPYESSLVFNAGVCKRDGRYLMVFRNDYGNTRESLRAAKDSPGQECPFQTNLGLAWSEDGVAWRVEKEPFWSWRTDEIKRVYDPRLTVIEGELHLCFAVDTKHGIRGGIGRSRDLKEVEVLHLSLPDNRNMVLFPERINGQYVRLERPFPVYSRGGKDRFDIWLGRSGDLRHWGDFELTLAVEDVPYANDKIGPAAPPIKTERGWLTTFHAVRLHPSRNLGGWEPVWRKEYFAGIMLLDLQDPSRVIGMSREPILSPEAEYERFGFRNQVVFPGGMILEDSGEVKIYYGAADSVVALATAHVDDLLQQCEPIGR